MKKIDAYKKAIQILEDGGYRATVVEGGKTLASLFSAMNWAGKHIEVEAELAMCCVRQGVSLGLLRQDLSDTNGFRNRTATLTKGRFQRHTLCEPEFEFFAECLADAIFATYRQWTTAAHIRGSLEKAFDEGLEAPLDMLLLASYKAACAATEAAEEREIIKTCHPDFHKSAYFMKAPSTHPLMASHCLFLGPTMCWTGPYVFGVSAWDTEVTELTGDLARTAYEAFTTTLSMSGQAIGTEMLIETEVLHTNRRDAMMRVVRETVGSFALTDFRPLVRT